MSETKHAWTPGPWRVEHENDETLVMGGDDNFYIATVHEGMPVAEHAANAALLAAAPALYEALARMTALVEAGGDPLGEPNRPTYEAARAALSAARGEEGQS